MGLGEANWPACGWKPVGTIVEATLTLRGLSTAAAELMADRLAGQVGVQALRLEHLGKGRP